MRVIISLLFSVLPAWAATCTLPSGTYTLSTSTASWTCGHIPTTTADDAVLSAGVNLTVDSAWTVKTLTVNGSSGTHVTLVGSGGSIISQAGMNINYADVSSMGSSGTAWIRCDAGPGITCLLNHSTVTTSGRIDGANVAVDGNATYNIAYNVFTANVATSNLNIATYWANPKTTGTRVIQYNVFDHKINDNGNSLQDFDVHDNYVAQGIGLMSSEFPAIYARNFNRLDSTLNAQVNSAFTGTLTDHYSMIDVAVSNPHDIELLNSPGLSGGVGTSVNRLIIDHADYDGGDGDNILTVGDGLTFDISHVIGIPTAGGFSPGVLVSKNGAAQNTAHVTHVTGFMDTAGEAMVRWSETTSNSTGQVLVKNSIVWGLGGTYSVAADIAAFTGGTVINDVCSSINCDYNFKQGTTATNGSCIGCTNQGNGYWGKFSATPGGHDLTGNPTFVDYRRAAALWDSKYLGNTPTVWSSGGSYTVGDMVSNTVTGTYYGLAVNYRRIANNTDGTACSGNPQPGVLNGSGSTAYKNCWEFASLYRIRQGVAAQTTITDAAIGCPSGCTYIEAIIRWTMAGYSPTNPALHNAGSDGMDIGAVAYSSGGGSTPPVLTQVTPPIVKQATTFQFGATCTGSCTWSLAAGSAGSINSSTGLYTAPSTVRHDNVIHGCPMPNDHIYNQKISTLPTDTVNSAAWITALGSDRLTYGVQTPSGENGFPLNIGNNSTPTFPMVFFYTPENNGAYMFLPPPYNQRENGAGANISTFADLDRHQMTLNADTCHIQELYKPFNVGDGTAEGCPLCTAQGGLDTDLLGYRLGHGVDAGGAVMMPISPRIAEIKAGTIKHAARIIIGKNRTYCNHHIWPAQSEACNSSSPTNIVPYGACMRLKSSFNISGFSATAQVLLQELKDYCMIASDGGSGGQINITLDNDTALDLNLNKAIPEIGNANIFANQFEFVDVSSLKTSDSTSGQVKLGGAVNPSTFATVIVTDSGGSSSLPVILQGVTVDVTSSTPPLGMPRFYIQAGTTKQFNATVRGTATTTVTWSRSPATGSVDSTGLYTAPGSISLPTDVTLTATSTVDGGASGSVTLTIMPSGTIRIDAGRIDTTAAGTVTTEGTWWNDTRQSGGGLCNYHPDNPWNLSDPNVETYYSRNGYGYGDHWYQYTVPNGWWKTTISLGDCRDTHDNSPIAPGIYVGDIESQGQTYLSNTDQITIACCNATAGTLTFTNQVTNGELWFVARATAVPGATVGKNLDLLNFKMEPVAAPTPSNNPTRLSGTITLKGRVGPIQ